MKNYIILQNLASGLATPFVSFTAAVIGVPSVGIGVVSSASSFFNGIVQPFLRRVRNIVLMLKVSTALLAVLWILMAFAISLGPIPYVVLYVLIASVGGANSFAWSMLMERLSRGARGRVLAEYAFFGSVGSLGATLVTGFVVRDNYELMRFAFMTAGVLLLINVVSIMGLGNVDDTSEDGGSAGVLTLLRSNRRLLRFLLINSLFTVVWSFAWPLFPLAQVYLLGMNFEELAIVNVIAGVSTLAMQRFVGALVDRNRKLFLLLGRLLLVTFPLSYALAGSVYVIYAVNVVSGFTNSVSNIAYISYVYDNSDDKRTAVSIYNAMYGAAALMGSLASGFLVMILSGYFGIERTVRMLLLGDAVARALVAVLYMGTD